MNRRHHNQRLIQVCSPLANQRVCHLVNQLSFRHHYRHFNQALNRHLRHLDNLMGILLKFRVFNLHHIQVTILLRSRLFCLQRNQRAYQVLNLQHVQLIRRHNQVRNLQFNRQVIQVLYRPFNQLINRHQFQHVSQVISLHISHLQFQPQDHHCSQ